MKIFLLLILVLTSAASAQVNVIYDDDCSDDVDCGVNFATLHQLADRGEIHILATMANSGNPLAAPAMKIYNTYYGRSAIPVGANKLPLPCAHDASCNGSLWLDGLVRQFDPGDRADRYADCVTLYRSTLAAQPDASVVIVETGFLTCLSGLLASPPDRISRLSGADLAKRKVAKLVIMGGAFPSGQEYNFDNVPAQTASVLSTWTAKNGYSPVWFVSFDGGASVQSGPPASASPAINPVRKAFQLAGASQRGSWDSLAILYAARGLTYKGVTYWTDSGDGMNTVDPSSGSNSWSARLHAGQHYLVNSLSDEGFSSLLDGYKHRGLAGIQPNDGHGKLP